MHEREGLLNGPIGVHVESISWVDDVGVANEAGGDEFGVREHDHDGGAWWDGDGTDSPAAGSFDDAVGIESVLRQREGGRLNPSQESSAVAASPGGEEEDPVGSQRGADEGRGKTYDDHGVEGVAGMTVWVQVLMPADDRSVEKHQADDQAQ